MSWYIETESSSFDFNVVVLRSSEYPHALGKLKNMFDHGENQTSDPNVPSVNVDYKTSHLNA